MHKKDQGTVGEALIIAQAINNGCAVFPQFGDNSKIDLIVQDTTKKLHRVQVKTTGREKKTPDVSQLHLYKNGPNYSYKYTDSDIDWFAIVDHMTQKIAWINAEWIFERCSWTISLRHKETKNGQKKGCWLFNDFTTFPFKHEGCVV